MTPIHRQPCRAGSRARRTRQFELLGERAFANGRIATAQIDGRIIVALCFWPGESRPDILTPQLQHRDGRVVKFFRRGAKGGAA